MSDRAFLAMDDVCLDYGMSADQAWTRPLGPGAAGDDATLVRRLRAVDRVNLHLAAGEVHCLLGRSGCGKTSLLKLAAGLVEPTAGTVRLQGQTPETQKAAIGFVFQSPTLLEWHNALDNVLLSVSLHRRPTPEDQAQAQALFDRLGLQGLETRRPRQLSGGQQSRVAIARALLTRPRLLLLDEPFAALDALTREELQQDLLRACRETGTTVLFVTHDIAEAVFLADRISLMEGGRLVQTYPLDLPAVRDAALRATPAFAAWGGRLREALQAAAASAAAATGKSDTAAWGSAGQRPPIGKKGGG